MVTMTAKQTTTERKSISISGMEKCPKGDTTVIGACHNVVTKTEGFDLKLIQYFPMNFCLLLLT